MEAETRRRGDTRAEIQRAALSRFTTQGYDKTSLREIAEDLSVTKAALYYHFRTKEDILDSLVRDVGASLEELLTWAQAQPSTREARLELIRRLAVVTQGGMGDLMRCVQQNELALTAMPSTVNLVHRYKEDLWRACTPPEATVEDKLRSRVAIMAVLIANHGAEDLGGTTDERREAALRIASAVMP
jgi:AcrR family transcriptional regulator